MSFDQFLQAAAASGIEPAKPIHLIEGKITRVQLKGDKSGSQNGWLLYYGGSAPHGVYGSWRTGASHKWRMKSTTNESFEERAHRRRQMNEVHRQWLAERELVQADASEKAKRLWRTARPATDEHPYLCAKGVHAYGIRQLRDSLVIPLRDTSGRLHTLQFIDADGAKRFLSGGRIHGCYFAIGKPRDRLYLCEGFATAASIFEATGCATAAGFACGNLKPAAIALRYKFPLLRFVIAADNDVATPGNPGVRHAFEAAAATDALVAIPESSEVA